MSTNRPVINTLSSARFIEAALALDVSAEVAHAADQARSSGEATLLVVSGKLGSGKDTIAPLALERLGYQERVEHLFYALALKGEVDAMIVSLTALRARGEGARLLRSEYSMSEAQAERMLELLWEPTREADHGLTAFARETFIRFALQFHGTEIRRGQDPEYWVKRALAPGVENLARGVSSYYTDCRFPNEVSGPQALGFPVIRLEISAETQRERILSRDGRPPTPEEIGHLSETALDGYSGFDLKFNNEGSLAEALDTIQTYLHQRSG